MTCYFQTTIGNRTGDMVNFRSLNDYQLTDNLTQIIHNRENGGGQTSQISR